MPDYRYVRLNGQPLNDPQWFEDHNWENFGEGDEVFTQDNDEIKEDVVYYLGHTDAIVFLSTRAF